MSDPLQVDHPGAFGSFLRWLGRPKNAVVDALSGNFEGAGRQLGDFAGDAVDSILPGDWIPELSRTQDYGEASDLVGGMDPGWKKTAVDVIGGIALDPISYVPGALIAKGAGKLTSGVHSLLPAKGQEIVGDIGRGVRRTFGAQRVSKDTDEAVAAGLSDSGNVGKSAAGHINTMFTGATQADRYAVGEVMHNIDRTTKTLLDKNETMTPAQIADVYFSTVRPGVNEAKVREIVGRIPEYNKTQLREAQGDAVGGGVLNPGKGVENYFPRQYKGLDESRATESRTLQRPSDVLKWLAKPENNKLSLEFDAAEVLGERGEQEAMLAGRAGVGKKILEQAKAGKVKIPDATLRRVLEEMPAAKPMPIPSTGTFKPADMMGAGASGFSDLYSVGKQTGTSLSEKAPGNATNIEDILNRVAGKQEDVYGVGKTHGMSKPPDTILPEAAPPDPYGIGRQSGKAKPPGEAALPEADPASLGAYGIGGQTGKAKPPAGGNLDGLLGGNAAEDLSLLGRQSGKALPPKSGEQGADLGVGQKPPGGMDAYGIGGQSGKASAPNKGNAPFDAALAGERPVAGGLDAYGVGKQTGKSEAPGRTTLEPNEQDYERARKYLSEQRFSMADPKMKAVVNDIVKGMPKEDAQVLGDAFNGMAPRGPVTGALAYLNPYFKKFAVYGAIIPKIGSVTRNLTSGVWQTMSNAEARGETAGAVKRLVPNILKSIDDGIEKYFGVRIGKGEFADMDRAFAQAGGDTNKAIAMIPDGTMREAAAAGVFANGYVSTEKLVDTTNRAGWRKWKNIMDAPGAMFGGAEQRMRYGLFKDLRAKGIDPQAAAKTVRDTFYDYSISSVENRTARDFIPFFQFTAKAIPQQADLFKARFGPAAAVGLSGLAGQSQGQPVYPYMQGKLNLPLGEDGQGNLNVASGFGLPFEALNSIPNPSGSVQDFGRDIGRSVIGATQPLVKTGLSAAFGKDPYFETPYGSYDKLPLLGHVGAAGRAYNMLAGTGAIQPVADTISTLGKITNPDRGVANKALDLLTGANVVTVDKDLALQQMLQQALNANPSVHKYTSLYQTDKDAETQAFLKELAALKAKMRKKKDAQTAASH